MEEAGVKLKNYVIATKKKKKACHTGKSWDMAMVQWIFCMLSNMTEGLDCFNQSIPDITAIMHFKQFYTNSLSIIQCIHFVWL